MTFAPFKSATRRLNIAAQRAVRKVIGNGALPHFLIIGAQKAGTTSLYDYLAQSPQIVPVVRKEAHHFDRYELPSLDSYRTFFPSRVALERDGSITGEATPFYMFHPYAAERISAAGLAPKLIAILRDPVARAVSHHAHEQRKGREEMSFAEAIACESERLRNTVDRVLDQDHLRALREKSYVSRGLYTHQLQRFETIFGRENLLVLSLDSLAETPEGVVRRCCDFLGVAAPVDPSFPIRNRAKEQNGLTQAREVLAGRFDQELAELQRYLPESEQWFHPR